jgi:hypothetical protein
MKQSRLLLLPAILLALATMAQAQEPPRYAPQPIPVAPQIGIECPGASWYWQAIQDGAAAWQRWRVMCVAGQAASCGEAKSAPGVAKGCAGGQAPKDCCCAKGCNCCETCKAKKNATAASGNWNPFAPIRPACEPMPCPPLAITTCPTLPACGPVCKVPQGGFGIVEYRTMGADNTIVRVLQIVQPVQSNPVHLVTPDLDARCDRMHHRGDIVVLEGNVLLLVKKHAQPIRIEAQRIHINMRDGSYSVVSDDRSAPASTWGVMRTSLSDMPNVRYPMSPATYPAPPPINVYPAPPPIPHYVPMAPTPPMSAPRDYSVPR